MRLVRNYRRHRLNVDLRQNSGPDQMKEEYGNYETRKRMEDIYTGADF